MIDLAFLCLSVHLLRLTVLLARSSERHKINHTLQVLGFQLVLFTNDMTLFEEVRMRDFGSTFNNPTRRAVFLPISTSAVDERRTACDGS